MGQAFIQNNAADMGGKKAKRAKRAEEALRELGIKDPAKFAKWLSEGGDVSVDGLTSSDADTMQRQYRTALMRFVNQNNHEAHKGAETAMGKPSLWRAGFLAHVVLVWFQEKRAGPDRAG